MQSRWSPAACVLKRPALLPLTSRYKASDPSVTKGVFESSNVRVNDLQVTSMLAALNHYRVSELDRCLEKIWVTSFSMTSTFSTRSGPDRKAGTNKQYL